MAYYIIYFINIKVNKFDFNCRRKIEISAFFQFRNFRFFL